MDCDLDVAIPGATQNEIEIEDAKKLVKKGVKVVLEGANMPSTSEAIDHFHENKVIFAAAKVRRSTAVLTRCCMLGRWLLCLRGGQGWLRAGQCLSVLLVQHDPFAKHRALI